MATMLTHFFIFTSTIGISIQTTIFEIDTTTKGPELIDHFLSVTIDAGLAGHWNEFDFNNPLINTLAKGLSPAYFRYGGTSGDETGYDTNGNISYAKASTNTQTLNMTEFSMLANFARDNDWKLVFGLNAQDRFENNTWNPQNARDLMLKVINSGIDDLLYGYELGNEPDLYDRHSDFMNVSARQLAKDFGTLYNLINDDVYKNANYTPFIWGCDIAYQFNYLQSFLSNSSNKILAASTWHHYYGNGATWTLSDFINIAHLDSLIPQINKSLEITHKYLGEDALDILGETSSTYGGGTANLSSSFVAGFLWLDKLGLAASLGLHVVTRQDFWGGSYGLIGRSDYKPNPDYWSSYLFKNLVGRRVLYVDGEFEYGRSIRCYAFCARTKGEGSVFDYGKGDVVVLVLNVNNETVSVGFNLKGDNVVYDEYLLTSYPNVIQSRDILLNGKVIEMVDNVTLPTLNAESANGKDDIMMDPLSYGFVVIRNSNATACV